MNYQQSIFLKRRSCRKFTDQQIDPNQVKAIVEAGLLAPTSMNRRPCQFTLVDDKELLEKLAQCKPHGADLLAGCALAIVVSANPSMSDVWVEDAAIASSYIQLQAESLGLGTCWVQVRNRMQDNENTSSEWVKDLLDMDGAEHVVSIIAIGHKDAPRPQARLDQLQWEKVRLGNWKEEQQP